jgi:hypothetical protein
MERITCPWKFGEKTPEDCKECRYGNLGDCPVGAYFARNAPEDRHLWEKYLVKEVLCSVCGEPALINECETWYDGKAIHRKCMEEKKE